MSSSTDRIPVPTNGHRPPMSTDDAATPTEPAHPAESTPDGGAAADPRIAFSPGQVAAGFGIIAALILLIAGRRRGKRE
ncbi:MAG: hypothetical protein ACSLFN_08735 [Candidatus Limnocylindrales bacterium]